MSVTFKVPNEGSSSEVGGSGEAVKDAVPISTIGNVTFGGASCVPKEKGASVVKKSFTELKIQHKFYRTTILQHSSKNIEQTFSERRVSWMNICKIILTICFAIPVSMYQWRYEAWALYFIVSFSGLYFWDYISHVRHLVRSKAQVVKYAIDECPYESEYLSARPDKVDLVAPYIIFLILSVFVIAFFETTVVYNKRHEDSKLIEMIEATNSSVTENISKVSRGTMKYVNN
ncbi:hypothetical protein [Pseudoalteromonas marina]|uniref:Uncharacterized protein n=1 Tax=Pseudoalteromonas marina TaxID=267375 RepID=A0ABT9FGG2_9GAMM|nr:hypothetical protein [Pseudoalteromonas marina]MDP2565867.1 hypothetical protein [Pseudoalteromonas marina]